MILKVDHIGVAVKDMDEAMKLYSDALGLKIDGDIEHNKHNNIKVAMLPVGETCIELLQPTAADSPLAKFIEQKGEGLHHIALRVDEIDPMLKTLTEKGVPLIDKVPRTGFGGSRISFLDAAATKAILELVER